MKRTVSTLTDAAGTTFQLTVDVQSTDVFLFPFKYPRTQITDNVDNDDLDVSPAYSQSAQTAEPSSSELGTVSNSRDFACLYAYCEIQVLAAASSSSRSLVANTLKSLSLSLVGTEQITFPKGGHETSQTYNSCKSITEALSSETPVLEVGKVYRFERCFFINHNTAPFQRSSWAVNNQQIIAKAVLHNPKTTITSLLGKTKALTATKKVYFVECETSETSDDMIVHEKEVRTHADGLGPFVLASRSQVFTVAGYLRTTLDLLSPLDGIKVVGLRGYIEQKTTLASRKDRPNYIETVPTRKLPFLDLDAETLADLFQQQALKGGGEGVGPDGRAYPALAHVSRLPDDRKLRPSTVDGNDAAIRFKHTLHYEIDFIDGHTDPPVAGSDLIYVDGQKLKRFHISYGAFIHSCGCRPDSLSLPMYERKDPMPEADVRAKAKRAHQSAADRITGYDKQFDPFAYPCICTFSLNCLLDTEKHFEAATTPALAPPAEIHPLPTYKSSSQDLPVFHTQ